VFPTLLPCLLVQQGELAWQLTGRVIGTSLLISFISYTSQIWVIWPWYGRTVSVDLLKLLFPFKYVQHHLTRLSIMCCWTSADGSAAVGMIWWNYRLCVTTNPGSVPDGYVSPPHCFKCSHLQPPEGRHRHMGSKLMVGTQYERFRWDGGQERKSCA
jgi:hypothetical protein